MLSNKKITQLYKRLLEHYLRRVSYISSGICHELADVESTVDRSVWLLMALMYDEKVDIY